MKNFVAKDSFAFCLQMSQWWLTTKNTMFATICASVSKLQ